MSGPKEPSLDDRLVAAGLATRERSRFTYPVQTGGWYTAVSGFTYRARWDNGALFVGTVGYSPRVVLAMRSADRAGLIDDPLTGPAYIEHVVQETWLRGYEALGSERIERVRSKARADAALFAEDFPGETLNPSVTDWDAVAWDVSRGEVFPGDEADVYGDSIEAANHDVAWEVYSETLYAEVQRLVEASSGATRTG